jgi:NAD(P)-dependent dehydrogenase (short-subunit alcohol dehydrogenase family)
MHVVLIDRNEVGLRAALESVRGIAGGGDVLSFALDAGDVDDVERMRDDVLRRFREVHVLMANHGIRSWVGTFSDSQSLKEVHSLWSDIINVNLLSILLVVQAFVPSMAKQPSESVIIATGSKLGIDNRPWVVRVVVLGLVLSRAAKGSLAIMSARRASRRTRSNVSAQDSASTSLNVLASGS